MVGAAAAAVGVASTRARAEPTELRIGVQHSAILLVLLKQLGHLEKRLPKHAIRWAQFSGGAPLLEALAYGTVDLGMTGDAPPVFAQAAGKELLYVAAEPARPNSSAILVKPESVIRSLPQLRGRKVALQKGSSAHFLVARAVTQAGLKWSDISPIYLTPADGLAAFERGDVDAWAIWDPYYAAAEAVVATRVLTSGSGLTSNQSFYLGSPTFVQREPSTVRVVLAALNEVDVYLQAHREEAARLYATHSGLDLRTVQRVLSRRPRSPVESLTASAIADQQRVADTFLALGLVPKPLRVADRIWRPA